MRPLGRPPRPIKTVTSVGQLCVGRRYAGVAVQIEEVSEGLFVRFMTIAPRVTVTAADRLLNAKRARCEELEDELMAAGRAAMNRGEPQPNCPEELKALLAELYPDD